MSKLSFRARALDAGKPMPIYMAEELPDLPDYSAINRAVPQMPSGMQKEEECEHHLQRAICAGLIIPTPEVTDIPSKDFYDQIYPANYKQPRQLIHMQPFTMEQDIPDYDMDSDDERWLQSQTQRLELSPLKFEEMMDRLEKSSGQTVVTLNEAKALLKEDDDLIIAVFDYWLNKRLKTQHPLILTVKTEHRAGTAANNPYLAFRRRTEKMQTRKNRKNDEASYEKMLKLRRDLFRAVTLLELVKRREKIKREYVHLTVEVFEKRYQARDFSGSIVAEASAIKLTRPAFTPIFDNHYPNQSWANKALHKDEALQRKEKRPYKKRKHKPLSHSRSVGLDNFCSVSSDEEVLVQQLSPEPEEVEDEGHFAFRRNKLCSYHMPLPHRGNWPWCSKEEHGLADKRFRFTLTSLSNPRRCIGFARRRVGRGGRVILDRVSTDHDDFWRTLDFSIIEADNGEVRNHAVPNNVVRTPVKSEVEWGVGGGERLGGEGALDGVKVEVKDEPVEVEEEGERQERVTTKEEKEEMVSLLQSIRREWLHFRPKTPPPEYEPPCHMLEMEPNYFNPSANTPFSMEIQTLEAPSTLLDSSTFITDPYTLLDPLEVSPREEAKSPLEETHPHINSSCHNTLTRNSKTVNDSSEESSDSASASSRTIGCSTFRISDANAEALPPSAAPSKKKILSSTLFSPKLNSVNSVSETRARADGVNCTNGLLSQIGLDVSSYRTKKLPYAYPSGVGYSNASTGTLSLRTSAHTLTLNSHSANILEIPIRNDTDAVSGNLVNSQCPEAGSTAANSKAKTIVRKNNLIMEVT